MWRMGTGDGMIKSIQCTNCKKPHHDHWECECGEDFDGCGMVPVIGSKERRYIKFCPNCGKPSGLTREFVKQQFAQYPK